MNKKTISILMTIMFIVQLFGVIPSFAQQKSGTSINFSNQSGYTVTNQVAGVQDYKPVKGTNGKPDDDMTMRLYTLGGQYTSPGSQYLQIAPEIDAASSGEYIHLSYEYLRENLYCGLTVQMGMIDSAGNLIYDRAIAQHLTGGSSVGLVRVLNGATNSSTSGTHYNYSELGGVWKRVDIYFSPDSDKAKVFIDGQYVVEKKLTTGSSGWGGSKFVPGVKDVFRLRFTHVLDTKASHEPSAVRLDNIVVEKVSSVPDKINYKKRGETVDFDDNMSIINGKDNIPSYGIKFYNTTTVQDDVTQKFVNYISARPSLHFKNMSNNTVETGIFGRKIWDKSLHTSIPSDASDGVNAMYYHPGASDLEPGYVGHLTFSVANTASDISFDTYTSSAVFSDGTMDAELFSMSAENGYFKFFGEDTNKPWENNNWYRVDMQFKVADDGTYADCFIDGTKLVSDYLWSADALKDIGRIGFADKANCDYYIDDVAYYVFDENETPDPSAKVVINTTDADLSDAIDNDKKIITISGGYKVEDFLSKITNPQDVRIYNNDGNLVYTGILANCSVAVTSGLTGESFYTIEKSATVLEAELFDIADGKVVIVKDTPNLNIDCTDLDSEVNNIQVFVDGKLIDKANTDTYSINLQDMTLGKHKFDVYAYINDKDSYYDSIELTLAEEKINNLVDWNVSDYSAGSAVVPGGRVVLRGGTSLVETVTDKNSVNYGSSMIIKGSKAAYAEYNNSQSLYYDIYTPDSSMITKAVVEFDFCLLNEKTRIAMQFRGKDNFNSTSITAATYSPLMISTSTTFNGKTINFETNRWYRLKSVVDVKNKVTGLWIDGVCYGDNIPISTKLVQIASELRLEMMYPTGYYDTADSIRYVAFDNVLFNEHDELAYVDSVYINESDEEIDYTSDTVKVKMSSPIEDISKDMITLNSTNGERAIKSVTIDSQDPSILHIGFENDLTSAEDYTLCIGKNLKSSGAFSTKINTGKFRTKAQKLDIVNGEFEYKNGKNHFKFKLSNQTNSAEYVTVITYVYENNELKAVTPKTVRVNAGKNLETSVEIPYYSENAVYYAFVADGWTDIKPISNKLFTYSY